MVVFYLSFFFFRRLQFLSGLADEFDTINPLRNAVNMTCYNLVEDKRFLLKCEERQY